MNILQNLKDYFKKKENNQKTGLARGCMSKLLGERRMGWRIL